MSPRAAQLFRRRRAGVLLHLTSLPGPHGIGDLGSESERFVDWCARAGLTLWQMLPVGPVGGGESPYSGASSFAGEPLLVSLERLADDGLLPRARLRASRALASGGSRYAEARAFKWPRFSEAFERFERKGGPAGRSYRAFVKRSAGWLPGWRRYAVARSGGPPGLHAFVQFVFDQQWSALRTHANARGVRLVGDLPIFVPLDSADVQDHPELFRLGRDGRPSVVTGVPPDMFSADGQLWGHPHYAWGEHQRTGYRWWTARLRAALERFDALRIDHFVGFVHGYEIPGSARSARRGRWRPTPGREVLMAARRALGALPLIAEDLGAVTRAVVRLREDLGLPGMKLLHNAFYSADHLDLPHRHPLDCVVYPGTHDNDTSRGWVRQLRPDVLARFESYAGGEYSRPERALVRLAWSSPALTAIASMQDLLGLGAEARFNRPGVAEGNWVWRMAPGSATAELAARMHRLTEDAGRLAELSARR